MLTSSLLSNALTLDEQQLIPEFLMNKLNEELVSYEREASKRIVELEKKIELHEDTVNEMNKKIVKQEMQIREVVNNSSLLKKYNEEYAREIGSLNNEISCYKSKILGLQESKEDKASVETENKADEAVGEGFDEGVLVQKANSELERLKERGRILEEDLELSKKKSLELERNNRKLVNKVLDQKNQISYLLKRSSNSDEARNNLELVRLVQKLSKRNDELEEGRKSGFDVDSSFDDSISYSKLTEGVMAEREEYRKVQSELYEVKKNGYALELEYNKIFKERNEIYNQLMLINEEKKMLQKYADEMKEELMYLKIDLNNTKTKNSLLTDASQRLTEMNNEIVRSNLIIKESRSRINELKAQLAESEERYNKYILEDRTNVTALLGREIEGIKKKLEGDLKLIYDLDMGLKVAIGEQKKLKALQHSYEERVLELERSNNVFILNERKMTEEIHRHKDEKQKYKSVLADIRRDVNIISSEVIAVIGSSEEFFMFLNRAVELDGGRRASIGELAEELDKMNLLISERDTALYSLIENRGEDAIALLGKERNILKQENVFLRNRIESLGDSTDFVEKINRLEEENEAVKTRFYSLEKAYVSEREQLSNQANALNNLGQENYQLRFDLDKALQEGFGLRNEMEVLRNDLKNSRDVIDKYKTVVEKLRRVKDAYLKLKDEGQRMSVELLPVEQEGIPGMATTGEEGISTKETQGEVLKNDREENKAEPIDGHNVKEGVEVAEESKTIPGVLGASKEHETSKIDPDSIRDAVPLEQKRGRATVLNQDEERSLVSGSVENRAAQRNSNSQNMDVGRDHAYGRGRRSERPKYINEDSKQGSYKKSQGEKKRGWGSYEAKKGKDKRG